VQARYSSNIAWDETTVKWTTAPTFAGSATDTQSLSYDPDMGSNGEAWVRWKIHDDVQAQYAGGQPALTEVLMSANEANNGWIYFAKRQYETAKAPRLFIVFKF
jgi:hypothetical protein